MNFKSDRTDLKHFIVIILFQQVMLSGVDSYVISSYAKVRKNGDISIEGSRALNENTNIISPHRSSKAIDDIIVR